MIAVPAIDLRGGHAVQLVGGVPGSERVRLPDPVAVAQRWARAGFVSLHIVDLDAALGEGDNRAAVARIIDEAGLPCQVGGGVRDDAAIDGLVDAGAERVITGTKAIEDAAWLERAAHRLPGRIIVAADVRDGRVVTRGWTRDTALRIDDFIATIAALPLAGVLVTDIAREGRQEGVDCALFERLARRRALPLQAAGGVSTIDDLRRLRDAGVSAAILGMALYTGTLDAATAAREFGS